MTLQSTLLVGNRGQSALLHDDAAVAEQPHHDCADLTEEHVAALAVALFERYPERDFEECIECVSEDWAPGPKGIESLWWFKPVLSSAFAALEPAQSEVCVSRALREQSDFARDALTEILGALHRLAQVAGESGQDLLLRYR